MAYTEYGYDADKTDSGDALMVITDHGFGDIFYLTRHDLIELLAIFDDDKETT